MNERRLRIVVEWTGEVSSERLDHLQAQSGLTDQFAALVRAPGCLPEDATTLRIYNETGPEEEER